ncbi:NAD(P)-dependent oxidoreductase [Adhaeribacter radiodurans]|uniref:Saccharopine dehydrogenase [NAD(+), L-lysine-forming] n=1 Tax=Adhaeribacter radiodurans TaxID=2745197 RepID=A0A7L7LA12_9BACT|nr:NAD(P)-dependent oxidoreductase [Adhaeribacter radiodurans]QMU29239.1 alanine dehydrogenase [Adhaeribacter radiodurans]
MKKLVVGIIREGKIPPDKRVPLTPLKCQEAVSVFPELEIIVQPSAIRSYSDQEYRDLNIRVQEDLSECDVLMGVKEVPIPDLLFNKTYFFFSHTIKKQPHNQPLLQAILEKNITLIDYETLTNIKGERTVAFGRYAGIVGAYNGIMTYGKKSKLFDLHPAHQCLDIEDMEEEYFKVKALPPIKIAVTGGGRVAQGIMEVLDKMGIRKVSVYDYLYHSFTEPVYAQLHSSDYNRRRDGRVWDNADFYRNPHEYESTFEKFIPVTDVLMAGAYWNPAAPKLFTSEDMQRPDFKITTIADVTCDVDGSLPCTKRASSIPDPVYDYNPFTQQLDPAFSRPENITVMAVDNLPCELPRSASRDFGRQLIDEVFPHLVNNDPEGILARATIAQNGKLTERYAYLQEYALGVEM